MTTTQAAQKVRSYLIERYALEGEPDCNKPTVWDERESDASGWEWAQGAVNVVWEGNYDWPHDLGDAVFEGKLELPGVFIEPATGYALSIYPA